MIFLRTSLISRLFLFLALTMLLIGVEIAVTRTLAFSRYPTGVSMAVLFDLVCVTTALFYWLVARPHQLANSRLLWVALVMLRLGFYILPQTTFSSAPIATVLLVLAEGVVLVVAILRIQTILQTYRQLRPAMQAEMALRKALASVFGDRAAGFILGEGLTLYYILLSWRLRPDVPVGARMLTTHQQSGQVALTVGLLVIGLIETFAVHVLATRWNATLAGWLMAISAYSFLYFVADLVATFKRPSYLTTDVFYLRLGVRWRVQINRSVIADVSTICEKPPKQPGLINGAFLTAPNVKLTFHEPVFVTGPFGVQNMVRQITFFVDDRAAFVQALQEPKLS